MGTLEVVVFCPHPPLLLPEVAAGAAAELDDLRDACRRAVATLLATVPRRVVVVGAGPEDRRYGADATGSFAPYGVAVTVGRPGSNSGPAPGSAPGTAPGNQPSRTP